MRNWILLLAAGFLMEQRPGVHLVTTDGRTAPRGCTYVYCDYDTSRPCVCLDRCIADATSERKARDDAE